MSGGKGYDHNRYAGNRGDVWKHYALARILKSEAPLISTYVETHAGWGIYDLGERYEGGHNGWGAGIARVVSRPELEGEPFQEVLKDVDPKQYPGSALVARKFLPGRRLILHEKDEQAKNRLEQIIPGANVRLGDGYVGLRKWLREEFRQGERAVVFIDPPYKDNDWKTIPACLEALREQLPYCVVVIWYHVYGCPASPYKKQDRLRRECKEKSGQRLFAVECIIDTQQRSTQKLNGSGLLMLNLPGEEYYKKSLASFACQLADMMKCEDEQPDHSHASLV